MIRPSRSRGFSLVELMITVAIMALLAAIAVPSYMRFSMTAKTSEAKINLAAIRTCQYNYRSENDSFRVCPANPPGWAAGAGASTPRVWADSAVLGSAAWDEIGYHPDGQIRYQYAVGPGGGGGVIANSFSATATGDLDEDGVTVVFTLDSTAANFPKVIKAGDDF